MKGPRVQWRIQEFVNGGGGVQGPPKGKSVGIFELTSNTKGRGLNPLAPLHLGPPLNINRCGVPKKIYLLKVMKKCTYVN